MHSNAEDCLERRIVRLLDCSDLGLQTVDGLWKTERELSVEEIDFRHNRFVVFNVSKLLEGFPNLQYIDLRDNPKLDCRTVWDLGIDVESDCKLISIYGVVYVASDCKLIYLFYLCCD